MNKDDKIKLFQQKSVCTHWDAEQEKWYFSIVDVIAILTDSERPRKYWSDLKSKLKKEGSELSENIGQLKMESADGSETYKIPFSEFFNLHVLQFLHGRLH